MTPNQRAEIEHLLETVTIPVVARNDEELGFILVAETIRRGDQLLMPEKAADTFIAKLKQLL